MRGQVQVGVARLGRTPVRERLAVWADVRIRKRRSEQAREVALMAAVADQRRRMLHAAWGRAGVAQQRLPY